MSLIDQINSHYGLFLNNLIQVSDVDLVLLLSEARINPDEIKEMKFNEGTEHFVSLDLNPIQSDEMCKRYKITFRNFIVYQVIDESWIEYDGKEVFVGNLIREFADSRFLEHAGKHFNLGPYKDFIGRKYRHFQIPCLNHIVDILGPDEPSVEEIVQF